MTEPERDAEITRGYRALDREEPPRALDEAILSAARGAVETHPAPLVAPTARRRWYVPLAAAAVIVLSVAVTLQMQREQPDGELTPPLPPPSPPDSQKEPGPAAPPAAAVPKAEAPRDTTTETRVAARVKPEPQRMKREPRAVAVPHPSVAPPLSRAPVPQPLLERPFPGAAEPAGAAAAPIGRAASIPEESRASRQAIEGDRPAHVAADALSKRAEEAESPERWLERIAALRREGRNKEADEAYAEFKRRYPEYRIPEAMREKVAPR